MKILHFLPDNHAWGGIEVYLNCTLPLLQQRGYQVSAAVTEGGQLAERLRAAGVQVHGLPTHVHTPILRVLDFRVLRQLLAILETEQPDLVHIHKGRIEQSMIRYAGFPLVYTYHSYGGPNNLENAPNKLLRFLYGLSRPLLRGLTPSLNGMLVVSDYERQRLYREGFLPQDFKAEVLYNGLPTESMINSVRDVDRTAIRQELDIPANARVVSFICRLTPDKNASAFLRIARRILNDSRRQEPVYFLVAGHGPQAEEFQTAFTQDPLLSKHGQFLGFRTDVPRLITASDVTVSTSLQEGFGLRVLESMLFGRPCVTYAAGGIPEVMSLPKAEDWLVPVGDEDAFVERLLKVLNHSDAELAELVPILQSHGKRFDVSHHVDQLSQFYRRVETQLQHSPQPAIGKLSSVRV
jgi:glycosyltransferase involved in cell wall biosynthesis